MTTRTGRFSLTPIAALLLGAAYAAVLPPQRALAQLRQWQEQHSPLVAVLLGNGTGSGPWRPWLAPIAPLILVPEAGTTLAARQRYWQLEPAQGWRRLLPRGLRQPPPQHRPGPLPTQPTRPHGGGPA